MFLIRKIYPFATAWLLLMTLIIILSSQRYASAAGHSLEADSQGETIRQFYFPHISKPIDANPMPPPIPYTTTLPLDPEALEQSIPSPWQLGLNKIGFHTGIGNEKDVLKAWQEALDAAGVPLFLKSTDNAEPIYEVQELMKVSGVPHTLVFRTASGDQDYDYDVPNYELPPEEAALIHWQAHKAKFPQELDPGLVWLETVNEVDKERAPWLAEFAMETGRLALKDGYRWAAFGWSSGEPERQDWESPEMLAFLRFAARHPDDIAIALHEYSYESGNIGNSYPYLIGRFQELLDVCDKHGIQRPTILITEWGWTYDNIPDPEQAMSDIQWASHLYAAYPNVKGAAIWFLGGGFSNIKVSVRALITPLTDYSLSNYFWVAQGQGRIDPSLFAPPPASQAPE